MSDFVKETIKRLLKEHGDSFFSDVNRLKGFLYDICPSFRKEVVAMIAVVQEGLIAEIKMEKLDGIKLQSLSTRLFNSTGIDKNLAEWSIRTWGELLKKVTVENDAEKSVRLHNEFSGTLFRMLVKNDQKKYNDVCGALLAHLWALGESKELVDVADIRRVGADKVQLASLSNRLYNATGIDRSLAEWSIKTWAEALGAELSSDTVLYWPVRRPQANCRSCVIHL